LRASPHRNPGDYGAQSNQNCQHRNRTFIQTLFSRTVRNRTPIVGCVAVKKPPIVGSAAIASIANYHWPALL
jgi:hypothetical protein